MANKNVFRSVKGPLAPTADAVNACGSPAYFLETRHALAKLAMTGTFNDGFYEKAADQLAKVLELCALVDAEFIAKTAIYARAQGRMKDMPAFLCAVLAARDVGLLKKVFPMVIDNGRMLRTFVQVLRSGAVGRKSMGTAVKRLMQGWFDAQSDDAVFKASVGNAPSLADIVKMVHPTPKTESRRALYGYLLGRKQDAAQLPPLVAQFESFKAGLTQDLPAVPFEMLTAKPLGVAQWAQIARHASWQQTRMNLNTFQRHGALADPTVVALVAARLRSREDVVRAGALPYQLLAAFLNVADEMPTEITEALQDAMDVALENAPVVQGKIHVLVDVSGSMKSPVTGERQGSSSKVRCVDVAGLIASAILRKNPLARVIPFEQDIVDLALNPRDSVMTNAKALAAVGGGGTNCSAPLRLLNEQKAEGDLVIFVSDNESWIDAGNGRRGTAVMEEWLKYKTCNPAAKLVCVDLTPNTTTQAKETADIMNIGGFSDDVFKQIARFAAGLPEVEGVKASEDARLVQNVEEIKLG